MNAILDSTWTAAQAMQTYPETVSVFLTLKTDCVGCYLARFCTLSEVANAYHLPPKQLLEKLEESYLLKKMGKRPEGLLEKPG